MLESLATRIGGQKTCVILYTCEIIVWVQQQHRPPTYTCTSGGLICYNDEASGEMCNENVNEIKND